MTDESLKKLVHDVNSKCASLKGAAALLKDAPLEERKELLRLMAEQAKGLAAALAKAV
ncbi:MAG: hypothetical protein FD126_1501 [Elusimicrobia bacterium]|nr:MAG: hypothetical protein FD126_1501 [Elusimicrobiota bacterium]